MSDACKNIIYLGTKKKTMCRKISLISHNIYKNRMNYSSLKCAKYIDCKNSQQSFIVIIYQIDIL